MYNIIERYMNKLKKEQISEFALQNNVKLSDEELDFTYNFVKKNWQDVVKNPSLFNIDRYRDKYSLENFKKIKELYSSYLQRYSRYL